MAAARRSRATPCPGPNSEAPVLESSLSEGRTARRHAARRLRSRRVRAVLAAGSVLGLGAAVTLAAWNDSEYATGTVTAATFGVEGSVDGSSFTSPEAPHSLAFSPSTDLTPGATSYALFSVRTQAGSTAGEVQVRADDGNTGGLHQHLTYGLRTVAGTSCDASSFESGSTVVERGSGMTADAASSQSLEADQGAAVNYCLELRLSSDAPNSAQGASATPVWEFLGTSSSG